MSLHAKTASLLDQLLIGNRERPKFIIIKERKSDDPELIKRIFLKFYRCKCDQNTTFIHQIGRFSSDVSSQSNSPGDAATVFIDSLYSFYHSYPTPLDCQLALMKSFPPGSQIIGILYDLPLSSNGQATDQLFLDFLNRRSAWICVDSLLSDDNQQQIKQNIMHVRHLKSTGMIVSESYRIVEERNPDGSDEKDGTITIKFEPINRACFDQLGASHSSELVSIGSNQQQEPFNDLPFSLQLTDQQRAIKNSLEMPYWRRKTPAEEDEKKNMGDEGQRDKAEVESIGTKSNHSIISYYHEREDDVDEEDPDADLEF